MMLQDSTRCEMTSLNMLMDLPSLTLFDANVTEQKAFSGKKRPLELDDAALDAELDDIFADLGTSQPTLQGLPEIVSQDLPTVPTAAHCGRGQSQSPPVGVRLWGPPPAFLGSGAVVQRKPVPEPAAKKRPHAPVEVHVHRASQAVIPPAPVIDWNSISPSWSVWKMILFSMWTLHKRHGPIISSTAWARNNADFILHFLLKSGNRRDINDLVRNKRFLIYVKKRDAAGELTVNTGSYKISPSGIRFCQREFDGMVVVDPVYEAVWEDEIDIDV